MSIIKLTSIQRTWIAYLYVGLHGLLLLIGCQANRNATTITVATRVTLWPSVTFTPSPTHFAVTPTLTPIAIATSSLTNTTTPTTKPMSVTDTPTLAAWLIDDSSNLLVYEAGQEDFEIYLLPPDQTSQFFAQGTTINGQPWSPDGTRFIFDRDTSGQTGSLPQLVIANVATGQESLINFLEKPSSIFWSPDGRYLLYSIAGPDHKVQIVLYDLEKEENIVITEVARERAGLFYLAGWSYDGQKIAFVSENNNQFDLYSLEVNNLTLQQLTNTPEIETIATWSPTEDQLMFGSIPNTEHALELWPYEANALYLVEGSGSNLTSLGNSYHILSATWSPNGEEIAYSNNGQICIFNLKTELDSCPLEDIPPYNTYFAASGDYPSWSADGNWLAFQATGHKEEL